MRPDLNCAPKKQEGSRLLGEKSMDIQKMVSTHQIQPKQCSGTEKSDPKGIFGANTFNATWTPIEVRQDQQSFRFFNENAPFPKSKHSNHISSMQKSC